MRQIYFLIAPETPFVIIVDVNVLRKKVQHKYLYIYERRYINLNPVPVPGFKTRAREGSL